MEWEARSEGELQALQVSGNHGESSDNGERSNSSSKRTKEAKHHAPPSPLRREDALPRQHVAAGLGLPLRLAGLFERVDRTAGAKARSGGNLFPACI